MALAGHGHVLGAVQPEPDRPTGQGGTQGRDRGEAVRLHLLAPEAAAHPQALHGHGVGVQAQHVGDDLLGLRRVLGRALDEDLAVLVDQGQRAVRLQVEVLLATELELAGEPVARGRQTGGRVSAGDGALMALERLLLDRLGEGHQARQRLVVDLDRLRAAAGGVQRLAQHPADGVPVEHHLGREQRLVVLDAGVVDPGHVLGGQHPDHAVDVVRRLHPQIGDQGTGVRCLHRPGVQHTAGAHDQVVGVESGTGDVQVGRLVRQLEADLGAGRPIGQRPGRVRGPLLHPCLPLIEDRHATPPSCWASCVSTKNLRTD